MIEKGPECWGACVPELPGVVVAGETREEVIELVQDAIKFHLEAMGGSPGSVSEFSGIELIE